MFFRSGYFLSIFEAGLIPMFLIIGIWGGPRKVYSAFKFFLFTLLGSVLMLVAIIAIYWISGTTDITEIYHMIPSEYQYLLWLAFFSSFAVKLPMWPVTPGYQMLMLKHQQQGQLYCCNFTKNGRVWFH